MWYRLTSLLSSASPDANPRISPVLRRTRLFAAGFFVFSAATVMATPAMAAGPYEAKELLRTAKRLEMEAGTAKEFTITFKNVGTSTWTNDGKNFVSVYTHDPKYRPSAFADVSWAGNVQPARMMESAVKPGQTGTFRFRLFAPSETGPYKETFHLAAESLAWVVGGQFSVDVIVTARRPVVMDNGTVRNFAPGYRATKLVVSDHQLALDAGTTREFRVGFKNVGKTSWTKGGSTPLTLRASTLPLSFKHASWSNDIVTKLPSDEIKPGQLALFSFTLAAPSWGGGGQFKPRFALMAGDSLVEGGEIEIPIEVRMGQVPAQVSPAQVPVMTTSGARGPNIRVGLFETRNVVRITAPGAYSLIEGKNHSTVRELSGATSIQFDFSTRVYTVRNGDYVFTAPEHVHFRPVDPAATIFEITSLENRPTWDPSINFNKFRGELEIHYVRATDKLWVIEELPIEDYMRGLAETSNGSPLDFQKALVTAARTYALFVVSIGGKHKAEYFDLNTTGNDQVYKGYASELVRPNVVRAVEETRGQIVAYAGELVVTPYFSRSDGRTRSWSEVWYGSHPWLVSVPAPYDKGKELWGHGVGMSASDAVGRANAGTNWQEILKYYYSGTTLKQLY